MKDKIDDVTAAEHCDCCLDARAEIVRLNAALDDMYGTEPCPKCGYGIDSCYGCKLVERDVEIATLRSHLAKVCGAGEALLRDVSEHSTGAFLAADALDDAIAAARKVVGE